MSTTCSLSVILWLQLCVYTFVESNYLDVSDIRLVGGSGPFGGRVEIQIDGVWGTVCDRDFHINDATVMCRMMGLLPTGFMPGAHFGQGSGPIFAQEFNCYGYETDIGSCTFESNVFCTHSGDVGVICSECGDIAIRNGEMNAISADGSILTITCDGGYETDKNTSICLNGSWSPSSLMCTQIGFPLNISDIRFGNGVGIADGRVEILVNDTWGTVCSNGIYFDEATVICNMLGFTEVYTYYRYYYYGYGQGTGPVYLANLECNGTETHINNCVYDIAHSCSHFYDIAVVCRHSLNVTDIRLVDGTGPYDGRVEVYSNDIWGTACDKNYDLEEMEIFCKMLDLNFTEFFTTPLYGQGDGPILIGNLYCTGLEEDVNNCTYYPPTRRYCNHNYDLTLVCTPCGKIPQGYMDTINGSEITAKCNEGYQPEYYKLTCLSNGSWIQEETCTSKYAYPLDIDDIRLAYSYIPSEGRVEILVDGVWGTICDNNFNIKSANVTCHMFGLQVVRYYTNAAGYGQGSGPVYIDNLSCTGLESHVNNCTYDVANTCTHSDDVSVVCTGYQLDITNIRLAGTSGPYHGRVELEVSDTWGTVGDDYFGTYEGRAVCRMLGLEFESRRIGAYYGQGSGPVLVDRLDCPYSATHINQCRYSVDNYFNTQHYEDVSVTCWGPSLNITEARLVNGTGAYDGRAEIKVNGTWGTICDNNFDILAADLFCNMLGLRAARYFTGALYGEGSGPVFIDQLHCDQYDADLSSCQYLFLNECTHDRDISVVCNECGQPDIYYWDIGYFSYKGSVLYADCSYYKTYVGTLQLTCDNETQTWIKEGECQEYGFPLNITEIRLVDGLNSTDGRVEIMSFDTWGTICDHSFGLEEANTICSMIGYPPAVKYYTSAYYGEGTGPIFVDDLICGENTSHINNCTYNTYDNCDHGDDISVVCTECAELVIDNGFGNSSATNYGAIVEVYCDRNYKVVGDSIIICQMNGTWSDNPTCAIIDCGDPTPEHGFSNASTTINGTTVSIGCNEGYYMVGDDIISCQENETWTDDSICKVKDCGYPSAPYADMSLSDNKTTYGETVLVTCWTGYTLSGSSTVKCLSNGSWEMMPTCTIEDCGDPTPVKGSVDRNETTFGSVVEVTCDPGYNISGNSTIV
ncbi:deleted in malignant brain tumors 1 protein-like [Mercenaria mercenaria]|uniref:deleted in malignant brain tumors 1 protein-like n=1 Tax=Mercenaria mercenaria TaxID=6596 RepID=UPI00234E4C8F|nr:deleted in malignant brain tumors 1 protein-like [Mercenaria mercenaria]